MKCEITSSKRSKPYEFVVVGTSLMLAKGHFLVKDKRHRAKGDKNFLIADRI